MESFSVLLAICAGNSPVTGEFPAQRPVTRSFDVFFDLRLNKRTFVHKISWNLEAARFGFILFQSLFDLTGTSAAVLQRSNFGAMQSL